MKIDGSLAAGIPLEEGERDDFPELAARLSDPQLAGIIIGTPVYFGDMTSLCKAFLERCIHFRKEDFAWSNKVAGVVAVGGARNGGQELTIQSVQAVLLCHEMVVVGGGSRSRLWRQICADVYGVPVVKSSVDQQAAALGAAALAAVGVGLWPDLTRVDAVHKIEDVAQPDPEHSAVYEELLPVFARAAEHQSELGEMLSELDR